MAEKLSGLDRKPNSDTAVIVSYFNPAGFFSTFNNLQACKEHFAKTHKIDYYLAEVVFPCSNPAFSFKDSIKLHSSSVMWQKEATINRVGLSIADRYKNLVWADSDLFWPDCNLESKLDEAFSKFNFIQGFASATMLSKERSLEFLENGKLRPSNNDLSIDGLIYGKSIGKVANQCHMGMVYGCTSEWFKQTGGLFPYGILGGGDGYTREAIEGVDKGDKWMMSVPYKEYKKLIPETKTGWVDTKVFHCYHGQAKNRKYKDRYEIAHRHKYDPRTDVKMNSGGVFEWSSNKPKFHEEVSGYFFQRQEDD